MTSVPAFLVDRRRVGNLAYDRTGGRREEHQVRVRGRRGPAHDLEGDGGSRIYGSAQLERTGIHDNRFTRRHPKASSAVESEPSRGKEVRVSTDRRRGGRARA